VLYLSLNLSQLSGDQVHTPANVDPEPVQAGGHPGFTLAEAAEQLGVHYMTAYRYVRAGQLEAEQHGGIWRVTEEALEAFRARREGSTRTAGRRPKGRTTTPSGAARRSEALADRLIAGDQPGAWATVESALTSGAGVEEVYEDLLGRALAMVGDRWASGDIGVADEHRASVVAMRVIGRMGVLCAKPGRTRGTIVLASAPGDRHGMPSAILADMLRSRGFRVVDLGADVPAEELAAAAAAVDRLVGVGICATTTPRGAASRELRRAVTAVRSQVDRPLLLGGAAITTAEEASRYGADHWAAGTRAALDFFEDLVGTGAHPAEPRSSAEDSA